MRKYIVCMLAALMCAAALPASAQTSWTSGHSGIHHKGFYAPWLYAVKSQTKSSTVKRNIVAFFIGMGYDHKIGNTAALDTREKLLAQPAADRFQKERAFQIAASENADKALILKHRYELQQSLKDNDVFEDYLVVARDASALVQLTQKQVTYLKHFFSEPTPQAKRSTVYTPARALKYDNGIILYEFPGRMYLIINADDKTVDVCAGGLAKYPELNAQPVRDLLADK